MQSRNLALTIFSLSIFSLAGAIVYFTNSVLKVNANISRIVTAVEVIDDGDSPLIIEASKIRQQIPAIISESEKIRKLVSTGLTEAEKFTNNMPSVVSESKEWRQLVPQALSEVELSRTTVNRAIEEISQTRKEINPALDQVEKIMSESRSIGKKTSEGAVSGVLTGAVRAPFEVIAGVGKSFFSLFSSDDIDLNQEDRNKILNAVEELVSSKNYGELIDWSNPNTNMQGIVSMIKANNLDDKECYDFYFSVSNPDRDSQEFETTLCRSGGNSWELIE